VAQILAQNQGPVGFDECSYGIRDKDGNVMHCGRSKPYAEQFGPGSVVGILLELPDQPVVDDSLRSSIESQYPPLQFGQYRFRQEILAHGSISFRLNGRSFGDSAAFEHIYHGKYYPAVSMYGGASVTLFPGPNFNFWPTDILNLKPFCEIVEPSQE
jgi:hypothetical protein